MRLELGDGRAVRSRTVVIATGARYRRPDCANLAAMEGRGVWYWASPIEARMCAGEEVVLVGGGNSAGQAAVFLSSHASKVWMLVRGPGLAASMSKYLIDRIAATPNIELLTRTEIVGLERRARVRHRVGHLAQQRHGQDRDAPDPPRVPLPRRRAEHRVAQGLRRRGRRPRLRQDGAGPDAAAADERAGRIRDRRRARGLGEARRAARSARARPSSRRSTPISPGPLNQSEGVSHLEDDAVVSILAGGIFEVQDHAFLWLQDVLHAGACGWVLVRAF